MKGKYLQKQCLRLAAWLLAAALLLPVACASAGTRKLQTLRTLTNGFTYADTVTENPSGRVESYALELAPGGTVKPILLQGSGTISTAASINKAVANAQAAGYHVLAAVNTDFFSGSTGIPLGIAIEDGVYKTSPENECAITVTDGVVGLVEDPRVQLTLTNQMNAKQVPLTHLNKHRMPTGGLYLMNEYFSSDTTRTTTPGWMVRLRVLDGGELSVSGTLTMQVVDKFETSEAAQLNPGEYILTADSSAGYGEVFSSFQVGDVVTLSSQCASPELQQAQWAGGAGDVMIRDGQITDASQWTYAKDGRAPRTALGVRWDGTTMLYVVDGRQSGYSTGLSQQDLAQEMLEQGCRWAVNLDGGGSSAMSVWIPGRTGPAIVNKPSDGRPRGCATYMLFVTDTPGDGVPTRLALPNDGLVVLAGSSVELGEPVALDSGLNLLDMQLPVSDYTVDSVLGTMDGGTYRAGAQPGTDTLSLWAPAQGLQGTAQLHVVDALTELQVYQEGSSAPVTELHLEPGQQVRLTVEGKYWSRTALRNSEDATWTVTGSIGTMDAPGVFTAARGASGAGAITVTAGGQTVTIPVTVTDPHEDVQPGHWAYDAVEFCYDKGLVNGVTDKQFGPDLNIRRGDFMLMLYRAVGKPPVTQTTAFSDVGPGDYYADAVSWGVSEQLVAGMGNGAFLPQDYVTREQAVTILSRALPVLSLALPETVPADLGQFTDAAAISSWAAEHVALFAANGIVTGERMRPQDPITRAEMVTLLYRLYNAAEITPPDKIEPPDPADPGTPVQPEEEDIPAAPVDLHLDRAQVTLPPGESVQLTSNAGDDVRWRSLSPDAAVTPDGVVTNLNMGSGDIDAIIEAVYGDQSAQCTVRCTKGRIGVVRPGTGTLNIRSSASTEADVTDRIYDGVYVIIREETDGWYAVTYLSQSGAAAQGYVKQDYIIEVAFPG